MDTGRAAGHRGLLRDRVFRLHGWDLCVFGKLNLKPLSSYRMGDLALELTHETGNQPPITTTKGETVMGATGKKDKGSKEQRKKPKLNIKEKRKQKNDKKNK